MYPTNRIIENAMKAITSPINTIGVNPAIVCGLDDSACEVAVVCGLDDSAFEVAVVLGTSLELAVCDGEFSLMVGRDEVTVLLELLPVPCKDEQHESDKPFAEEQYTAAEA